MATSHFAAVELLRNISHAVQSPVGSMANLTELILLGVEGDINEAVRQAVTGIAADLDGLHPLLENLLALCRLDSSPPALAPLDLGTVLPALEHQRNPTTLTLHLPGALPLVKAQAELVVDLLTRLVAHHARFTAENGIHLRASVGPDTVTLVVGDTGDLPLSSPACPVELPGPWIRDGLALEVLICQRLVEQLGGVLGVRQAPDGSLAWQVVLPAITSPQIYPKS